jgi:hypothetical protein
MGNSWLTWLATEAAWGVQAARCAVGTGQSGLKIDCRAILAIPPIYSYAHTNVSREHSAVKISITTVYN